MCQSFVRFPIMVALLCWATVVQGYSIAFQPAAPEITLGGQLAVNVVVSGLQTDGQVLSTYDVDISFDAAVLSLVSADSAGALGAGSLFFSTVAVGLVNLFELSSLLDAELAALQSDFFTIATLLFTGTGEGVSPLTLSSLNALGGAQFTDPQTGQTFTTDLLVLPHTVSGAVATVGPRTVPLPGTLPLLALGSALLLAVRRWHFR